MTSNLLAHDIVGDVHACTPIVLLRPIAGSNTLWGRFLELLAARRAVIGGVGLAVYGASQQY